MSASFIFPMSRSVAYLGFPAPGYKVSFGAPTQHVHGSIDSKSELGVKGRRKLIRDLRVSVSRTV